MTKKIDCKIVKDLLPLYIDDLVSDETRMYVEKHLKECSECMDEYKKMSEELIVPINSEVNRKDAEIISEIKKKFKNKKFRSSLFSSLAVAVIFISLFFYSTLYEIPIEYSANNMNIIEDSGKLYLNYRGNFYGSKGFSYSKNYKDKTTDVIYLYDTPLEKLMSKINKNEGKNKISRIYVGGAKDISEVYYGKFNIKDSKDMKEEIKNKKLIWSNN